METREIRLVLKGLDCANCASKIENKTKQLEGVADATVNFSSQLMTVKLEEGTMKDDMIRTITEIVNRQEPDVEVTVKEPSLRKQYLLDGLDCANCAMKIQDQIASIDGIGEVRVDFATTKLSYEVLEPNQADKLHEKVIAAVQSVEPDVIVRAIGSSQHKDKAEQGLDPETKEEVIRLGISALLFVLALLVPGYGKLLLFLLSYIIAGKEVLLTAIRNIFQGEVFDENFLMAVATMGALAIREYPEAVAVMLFYQVGEVFQSLAVNRSRRSIAALMDIRPDTANLKTGDGYREAAVEEVNIGDIIVVKAGEKIPLDGTIVKGQSLLDTSALTGESVLREVQAGDMVYGGFINHSGLLEIEVASRYEDSKVAHVLELVEHASARKAPTEQFITKFARVYTPAVVFGALLLALIPPLVLHQPFSSWLYRALIFLVVSCPCALVVSIPLGFFGGIGAASRSGILIKGGNYLEALNHVDTVLFDKTGTLTKGTFAVSSITPYQNSNDEEILSIASHLEQYSNHPIAKSILQAYQGKLDRRIEAVTEYPGSGICGILDGTEVRIGNAKWMNELSIQTNPSDAIGTVMYVARENQLLGQIVIADEIKADAVDLIAGLKQEGIRNTVMLTGDADAVGKSVAAQLKVDEVHTQLMPDDKVRYLEQYLQSTKGKVMFVGDGINDAPVLAQADIGVAMGSLGSDAAIEAADIVLMSDEPTQLITAIRIAKKTTKIVWQNIILAFAVKAAVLLMGAAGFATMWEAVFADVGVTILAVLNSIRILNGKK